MYTKTSLLMFIAAFLKKKRFYLFMETHRERQRHRQREKQAPRRETDAGLIPGSPPELKADAQLLSHPGTPFIAALFLISHC